MMHVRIAIGLGFLGAAAAMGQSIEFVQIPQSIGYVEPLAISGDGSRLVGYGTTEGGRLPISWSGSLGTHAMGGLAVLDWGEAAATSYDGSVVVGKSIARDPSSPLTSAVRWDSSGVVDLGRLPGRNAASARGVSSDGSVVVGVSYNEGLTPTDFRSFRWTASGGMQDLGVLPGQSGSYASAVSGDGSTIVGVGMGSGPAQPFRWTAAGGLAALPMPAGAYAGWTEAVSGDGSMAAGAVQGGAPGFAATIWEGNSVHLLHTLPGVDHSWVSDITADGSLLVGHAMDYSSGMFPVLWNAQREMVNVTTYAMSIGVDLTGWELWSAAAVSDDGTRIAGTGMYQVAPGYWREQGWVMTIPGPGSALVLGAGFVVALGRRRSRAGRM